MCVLRGSSVGRGPPAPVVTCWKMHALVSFFPSLTHFPTPLLVFPGITFLIPPPFEFLSLESSFWKNPHQASQGIMPLCDYLTDVCVPHKSVSSMTAYHSIPRVSLNVCLVVDAKQILMK